MSAYEPPTVEGRAVVALGKQVQHWRERAERAEVELAALRGALLLAERDEDGRCNVCGHETTHFGTCEVGIALRLNGESD